MAQVDLAGVHKVTARGHTYYYAWRGRGAPRLPGKPGSAEFIAALKAAHDSRGRPDLRRVKGLVQAYRASIDWKRLSDGTRKVWAPWLDRIQDHFGALPLGAFARPAIKADIRQWRDGLIDGAKGLRRADMALQVLSRLMSYAVAQGLLMTNPCEGIEKVYASDRSDIIWTPDDMAALRAVASAEVWWAAQLAALTGMRQDDCRKLTWAEVGDLAIERRAGKSRVGKRYLVPIYPELRELLDAIPRRAVQVLTNTRGVPWRSGLSDSFADAAKLAKVDKHFHDLRGTAATRMYLAGLTLREIAEVLAWEEDQVHRIINRYVRRDALLRDRIARLEGFTAGQKA